MIASAVAGSGRREKKKKEGRASSLRGSLLRVTRALDASHVMQRAHVVRKTDEDRSARTACMEMSDEGYHARDVEGVKGRR